MRYLAPLLFAFLNRFTGPERNEVIWIRNQVELFTLDERLFEVNGILSHTDVCQQIPVTDVMFNPTNAVFGRLLHTPDGHIVSLAYWEQHEKESHDEIPYYENKLS